jgi:predicted glycogen debranching enzyme
VGEAADYNTIDATLWFIDAVGEYFLAAPDDTAALDALYPALRDSIEWHIKAPASASAPTRGWPARGRRRPHAADVDGRQVGDVAFTPRAGKAVEIQALWFNALHTTSRLASQAGDSAFALECAAWARKGKKSFEPAFWNEREGCLFDVVDAVAGGDERGRNAQIRPNQIFALSLRQRLLPLAKEKSILAVVERDLLTPFGLRSLSPRDPAVPRPLRRRPVEPRQRVPPGHRVDLARGRLPALILARQPQLEEVCRASAHLAAAAYRAFG